jgi:hypothetical protein
LNGDRNIRLLKVLPRKLFKPLECEMIEVILDNAKSFEALSHIHSSETAPLSIWIRDSNGATALKIPLAIHQFLQFRRTFTGEKLFWIDVVCVNQEDDDEANKQAAMLRDIYRHASRVIVWLGPQSNAQAAFLARETLSYVAMSLHSTSTQSLLESLQGRRALGLNAVAGLLDLFNRQWVVPVVTVSDEVHVIYGDVCFRWDTLAKVVKRLSDAILEDKRVQVESGAEPDDSNGVAKMWKILPLISNVTTINLFRDLVKLTKPVSMDDDLARCMCIKATNPSDRVYAMLAIIGGRDEEGFVPEYRKPAFEVYNQAMRTILLSSQGATSCWNYCPPTIPTKDTKPKLNTSGSKIEVIMMANQRAIKVQVGRPCAISVFQGDNNDIGFGGTLNSHLAWVQSEATRHMWKPRNPDIYETEALDTLRKAVKGILADAANALSASFWQKVEDYIKNTTRMETMEEGEDKIKLGEEISTMEESLTNEFPVLKYRGHRFGITKEKRKLAFVPPSTRTSDNICAVKGLSKPLVFRRKVGIASQGMGEVYRIIDECYIDGRMGMVKSSSWKWLTVA